ncbi:MAG: hypothetical protein HYY60_02460, partial [Parcubacteria group bacterium]|nr:hypothetical protein [Parcubacteria group bacterium]
GADSPFAHRTVTYTLQFRNGTLTYAPYPQDDKLIVNGSPIPHAQEPESAEWPNYNIGVLYGRMWRDILGSIREGTKPRHTLAHGLNVADACTQAFQSAHEGGRWREVDYQWERQ